MVVVVGVSPFFSVDYSFVRDRPRVLGLAFSNWR
jgi:hypothetical protein